MTTWLCGRFSFKLCDRYLPWYSREKNKLVLGYDLVVPDYSHLGEARVFVDDIFNSWFQSIRIFFLKQKENGGKSDKMPGFFSNAK